MSPFFAYVLLDERKPGEYRYGHWKFRFEPFYVGKGKSNRPEHHVREAYKSQKKSHKLNKIRKILNSGYEVLVRIIPATDEEHAFSLEEKLVSVIGRYDMNEGPLTNRSSGGLGNGGHSWSRASKRRLSQTLLTRKPKELATYKEKLKAAWAAKTQEDIDERSAKIRDTMSKKPMKERLASEKRRLSTPSWTDPALRSKTRARKQRAWKAKTEKEVQEIVQKRLEAISPEYRKEINAKLKQAHARRTEKEKAEIRAKRSAAIKANWKKRRAKYGTNGRRI